MVWPEYFRLIDEDDLTFYHLTRKLQSRGRWEGYGHLARRLTTKCIVAMAARSPNAALAYFRGAHHAFEALRLGRETTY